MVTKLSSIQRSVYKNTIGDVNIQYNISQETGKDATNITGVLKKGEVRLGEINIAVDGTMNIYTHPGLNNDEKKNIVSTVIDDVQQIYNELNQ